MINRDCRTCAFSAYCAPMGADLILKRLRRCRVCGDLSYIEPPDANNIVKRRSVRVSCSGVVAAWMLRGDVEQVGCPICGEKGVAKIKESAVGDVVKECREMEGFDLGDEGMQVMPAQCLSRGAQHE